MKEQIDPTAMVYMSLLSTDSFLPGALVLHYSLTKTAPRHRFVLLVTEDVSAQARDVLDALEIATLNIESRNDPGGLVIDRNEHMPHWERTFSKLQVLRQAQFEKIVFVDADMLVCRAVDELFSKPGWSAVNAGGLLPEKAHWTQLNSGLLVVEPSEATFEDLMDRLREFKGPVFSDQDCFHAYLPEWPQQHHLHLDHKYNMFANLFERYRELFGYRLPVLDQPHDDGGESDKLIHILHFVGPVKPWGPVHQGHASRKRREDETTKHWTAFFKEMCAAYGLDPVSLLNQRP